jgi:hypothetical protein
MKAPRKKRPAKPKGATFPLKDKIIAFGIPLTVFGLVVGIMINGSIEKHSQVLDTKLSRWREVYHLNEAQVKAIKRIEIEFHGNGSPFTVIGTHSSAEIHQHHITISRAMSPEDGARYLAAMERSAGVH